MNTITRTAEKDRKEFVNLFSTAYLREDRELKISLIDRFKKNPAKNLIKYICFFVLNEKDCDVKIYAMRALAKIKGVLIDKTLINSMMNSNDIRIIEESIMILGQRKYAGAILPIIRKLNNTQEHLLKRSCIVALGYIRRAEALLPLYDFFCNCHEEELRRLALDAIDRISSPLSEKIIMEIIEKEINEDIKVQGIYMLGRRRSSRNINFLINQFNRSSSQKVKTAVISALIDIDNYAALKSAYKLANELKNEELIMSVIGRLNNITYPHARHFLECSIQ
ncbi:MAG: hypothetical protein NZM04_00685 [Methylacidiphilales bacterium]|nr:hypothetical protein [Candidatus Methylacidiphilales bacterium]